MHGFEANALSYDYTASIECLENPHKPQYGGGIIVNPELNHGLKGWSTFGEAKIQHRQSQAGNKFAVACSRNQAHAGISQKIYLQRNKLYTFSAWIQVSGGSGVPVTAIFKTSAGSFIHAGAIVAESKCWSMLKGGLTVNASGLAELYFESKNTTVEIWVDSISLQPFTEKEWKSHHDQSIEKIRKSNLRIQAVDAKGNPLPNATISIQQRAPSFPFGCAMNKNILTNTAYQNWFSSRFGVTTFENEMKWYSTEPSQGQEDYSVADAMLQFAKQQNIAVRGHNVFWDDPQYQLGWVKSLDKRQLARAAFRRDGDSTPAKYLQRLRDIQDFSGNNNSKIAIGLESHFKTPNIPYIRSSIDTLAAANLPIWITELDVENGPNQSLYLEQILREVYAHPQIQGIVIWAAWNPQGCYRMCLTDNNFTNLQTGDVVDTLLHEWGLIKAGFTSSATTDTNGVFEASLPHGDYEVKITDPESVKISSSMVQRLNVAASTTASQLPLLVQLSAA
ncbi:hypothetical protein M0R45_017569 [Rubus argutus]|uniref:GH10 domain-containing protein n=1 Tax=Rubus argutus TaxID=59490 RepID=A0AAW1XVE4_RUBAR